MGRKRRAHPGDKPRILHKSSCQHDVWNVLLQRKIMAPAVRSCCSCIPRSRSGDCICRKDTICISWPCLLIRILLSPQKDSLYRSYGWIAHRNPHSDTSRSIMAYTPADIWACLISLFSLNNSAACRHRHNHNNTAGSLRGRNEVCASYYCRFCTVPLSVHNIHNRQFHIPRNNGPVTPCLLRLHLGRSGPLHLQRRSKQIT